MQNKINKNNTQLNKKLNTEYKNIKLEPVTSELVEKIEADKDYKENEKYNVDYFSTYCDMLRDYDFKDKIETFGAHYFLFFTFLKMEMLNFGKYYVYEKNIKRLIKEYCISYSADLENVNEIYADLVKSKYINILKCSCFEYTIITESVIFYNYRLVQEKRVYNRNYKRKQRADKKAEQEENTQINETEEAPSEPLPEVPVTEPDTPIKPDDFGFGETYEENPFF